MKYRCVFSIIILSSVLSDVKYFRFKPTDISSYQAYSKALNSRNVGLDVDYATYQLFIYSQIKKLFNVDKDIYSFTRFFTGENLIEFSLNYEFDKDKPVQCMAFSDEYPKGKKYYKVEIIKQDKSCSVNYKQFNENLCCLTHQVKRRRNRNKL
jgi:hypothetical protein